MGTTVAGESIAKQILSMTGARTKLAWIRATVSGPDLFWGPMGQSRPAKLGAWRIMVFDTAEGTERVLMREPATYNHPLISLDGEKVIWSVGGTDIYVTDWSGKGTRRLCGGHMAIGVAENPPGTEWVYVLDGKYMLEHKGEGPGSQLLYRYRLDQPSVRELVWDKTYVNDRMDILRDGTMAGGGFPWPNAGIVDFRTQTFKRIGEGCDYGFAPDGSQHFWHMEGPHRGVWIYDQGGVNKRYIDMTGAPGMNIPGDTLVWYASWAKYDTRFFTISGPHMWGNIPSVGDILFGQFDEALTKVVKWVKVSDNPDCETQSYAWIDPDGMALTDGLEAKKLAPVVKRIEKAKQLKPIIDELQKLITDAKDADQVQEATALIQHLDTWGDNALARGKKKASGNPAEAATLYKDLAARYAGLPVGATATQRLAEPSFCSDLAAWTSIDKLRQAERKLKEAPGKRSAKNDKFALRNKGILVEMRSAAHDLEISPASPWIVEQANLIMARYELDPITATGPKPAVAANQQPSWPDDEVAFLWQTRATQTKAFDAGGNPYVTFNLTPAGIARFDQNYAMILDGGSFQAPKAEAHVIAACRKTNELSLEAFLTPIGDPRTATTTVIALGSGPGAQDFALRLDKGQLFFDLTTSAVANTVTLGVLAADGPTHIVLSYRSGSLVCYANGKPIVNCPEEKGDLSTWGQYPLSFGQPGQTRSPCKLIVEGVAIYARALDEPSAQRHQSAYRQLAQARKTPARLRVDAKLVQRSPVPTYAQIAPYANALAVYEYAVEKVLSGSYDKPKLRVAHWGMLDRQALPIASAEIGKSCQLDLELFDDNPQLRSEFMADALTADPDLPVYYARDP
jgi:hypothetical protein